MKRREIELMLENERFSRRMQDGVEILERETLKTIRLNRRSQEPAFKTMPRLVIEDAISRSKLIISKSRSQLGDIDAFLRSVARRPLDLK